MSIISTVLKLCLINADQNVKKIKKSTKFENVK